MDLTVSKILDLETGEIISCECLLRKNEKDIFELRRKMEEDIQNNKSVYVCAYCNQKLKLRAGVERVHHFAHLKDSDDCPLKTGSGISQKELEKLIYQNVKESQRHITIKKRLFDIILTDKRFCEPYLEKVVKDKNNRNLWRKPDIQCKYKNDTIVFEVQLSNTFLSVIVARENFYKDNAIPIIWIFDSFNKDYIHFYECDILYYHNCNVFILDDETFEYSKKNNALSLKVYYLVPDIRENKIIREWCREPSKIDFSEIRFKQGKAFYYDYENKEKELINNNRKEKVFAFLDQFENKTMNTEQFKTMLNSFTEYGFPEWKESKDIARLRILFCAFYSITKQKIIGYKGNSIIWLLNIIYENFIDVFWIVLEYINNTHNVFYIKGQDKKGSFQDHVKDYRSNPNIYKEQKYTDFLISFFSEINSEIAS